MSMKIFPERGKTKIAIINPAKKFGDAGQYITQEGSIKDMEMLAVEARRTKKEIRWYYRDLVTAADETVASQIIVTEIPPKHVQPFHTHHTLHEVTLVISGQIAAIDSKFLSENVRFETLKENAGAILGPMQMVVEGPGTRHTIMNVGEEYALLVTTQTARIPLEEFPHDWHRDGK